ncbi:MAG TPA: PilZ domain-containing protein [Pyrinomonadaceae bacterium]|jgi:hypothetical protein
MEGERRKEQRFSLPLEVRWESLSGKYAARISDLSIGGCYIESLAQVSTGEEIHFEIQLPTGFWMPLRGTVVYHQPTLGFGVSFANLTMMERNVLARVLNTVA